MTNTKQHFGTVDCLYFLGTGSSLDNRERRKGLVGKYYFNEQPPRLNEIYDTFLIDCTNKI